FGLCRPVDIPSNAVYGLIQYLAPEILSKKDQAIINSDTSSDIYSFGMVMWEVSTTYQPFSAKRHNEALSSEIINALRPDVMKETPPKYSNLMERCWSDDVSKRPSIKEIQEEIRKIVNDFDKKNMDQAEME